MARTRSEPTRVAILHSALDLLAENGYGRLTMEGIARRAGVSKQTVYRWWPSRAAVLMEALNERAASQIQDEDHGALEADLRSFISQTVAALREGSAPLVAGLMAEAQFNGEFATVFREQFIARRRDALRAVLRRAGARGELRPDADLNLLLDIAFGTVWYRVLNRHAPLTRRFADQLTDALLELCRA